MATSENANPELLGAAAASAVELIQWERELLQREREILQRERDLLNESRLNTTASVARYYPNEVVDLIPIFEPGKISCVTATQWVQKVNSVAEAYAWDDPMIILQAVSKLKGAARSWYDSTTIATWLEMQRQIIISFPTGKDDSDIHLELMKRRKLRNESYEEYFYAMMQIAKKGSVSDSAIIKYLITGLNDPDMTKTLAMCEYDTPHQLFKRIKAFEDTMKQGEYRRELIKNTSKIERSQETQVASFSIKCFNCGKRGHKGSHCPDMPKGIKCFACGKFGHRARECKEPKNTSERRNETYFVNNDNLKGVYNAVQIGNKIVQALFDTGSTKNLITSTEYLKLKLPTPNSEIVKLYGLSKSVSETLGSINTVVKVNGEDFDTKIYIVPDEAMTPQLLLGTEFLQQTELSIFAGKLKSIKKLSEEKKEVSTKHKNNSVEKIEENVQEKNKYEEEINEMMMIDATEDSDELFNSIKELPDEIQYLILNYEPNPTRSSEVEMRIILTDDEPIHQRPRRLARQESLEVEAEVQKLMKQGIIVPSNSEYASPIVPVRRKNGNIRLCVDYRQINKKTIKDRYPLPIIEDQLERLRDAKIFSTIDLKNGFHHIDVNPKSRKYTSFVTQAGQYEFTKTPFGLSNGPAIFQRFIDKIFKDLERQGIVLTFIDDLIIPARCKEEAFNHLKLVLQRASEFGLEINWSKCQFLRTDITYLGYQVSNNEIRPSETKIKDVLRYPEPKSKKALQSFLGLTGYFRKFIKDYAKIAKPLSDLIKKENEFKMEAEQKIAVAILKKRLTENPVLKIYNPLSETELHTDASQDGYGAILLQKDPEDNCMHPIFYMSKKTTDAERKRHSYELEVLAIVRALEKFRHFLLGIDFTIITDCNAFAMTMRKKEVTAKIWRWAAILEEFNCKIEHRAGDRMRHCDALSRNLTMMVTDADTVSYRIRQAQENDTECKKILEKIQNEQNQDFEVKNGLLYKLKEGRELLYIPKGLQTEMIKRIHEAGHFAMRKTKEMFQRDYWMSKLNDKIEKVINNCIPCILTSAKLGKRESFLNPINKEGGPLHTLHIDHLGPLAPSTKNYKHLFVIIDAFTKFTWIFPTRSTTAKEVLEKMHIHQKNFGNPKRIVSDRGTAYNCQDFKDYCNEEGIEHILITTGVPRGNGQVERIHQVIKSVLAKLSYVNPDKWYKFVQPVQRYINSTYQRSIDTTPFELMIGVQMRNKEDIRLREMIEEENRLIIQDTRDELRQDAKKQIAKVQAENQKNFNKRRKKAKGYQEGDLVAIKRTQFTTQAKLKPRFFGPYKITAVKSCDRYNVEKLGDTEGPKHTSSSADLMKPWAAPCSSDNESSTSESSDEETQEPLIHSLQVPEVSIPVYDSEPLRELDQSRSIPSTTEDGVKSGTAEMWERNPYAPPMTRGMRMRTRI